MAQHETLNPRVVGLSPTLGAKCSMNNKNPETDIGVQTEDQKRKAAKPIERSYLCKICPRLRQTKGWSCNALHQPQTPHSTEFLSLPLYIPFSAHPYASVSTSLALRLGLCDLFLSFSFRQIQSCVAQGGLDITQVLCFCLPTPGTKGVGHHCLAYMAEYCAALPSNLQASFVY